MLRGSLSVTSRGREYWCMRPVTTFARALIPAERQQLQAGLRTADAFTLRRAQILLASADRQTPAAITRS